MNRFAYMVYARSAALFALSITAFDSAGASTAFRCVAQSVALEAELEVQSTGTAVLRVSQRAGTGTGAASRSECPLDVDSIEDARRSQTAGFKMVFLRANVCKPALPLAVHSALEVEIRSSITSVGNSGPEARLEFARRGGSSSCRIDALSVEDFIMIARRRANRPAANVLVPRTFEERSDR